MCIRCWGRVKCRTLFWSTVNEVLITKYNVNNCSSSAVQIIHGVQYVKIVREITQLEIQGALNNGVYEPSEPWFL